MKIIAKSVDHSDSKMDQQAEGLIIKKKLVYLHKNQDTGFIGAVVHLLALAGYC